MDQKILNKTITISEVVKKQTTGGNKYAIKDHEGRTFNFFTTKKDGEDTSVYAQFKNMELGPGDTVMIGYVEDEFVKDGKTIISKKIINFRETREQPTQTASQGKSSHGEPNFASDRGSSDAFGRRLALHGFVNGMLANGATVETIVRDLPALLKLEDAIDHVLSGNEPDPNVDLPTIDVNEDDLPPF